MPVYDLLIQTPEPCAFIVSAHGDVSAASLVREILCADYQGETDPATLAARICLMPLAGGKAVLESTLGEVLGAASCRTVD